MSATGFAPQFQVPKPSPHLQDIDLAYRTLQFIGSLTDAEINANPSVSSKMRDIGAFICRKLKGHLPQWGRSLTVANICDFQHRFSIPMELPFGFGADLKQKLDTPRPLEVLLRFHLAFPVPVNVQPIGLKNEDDIVKGADGKLYAMAGTPQLSLCVELCARRLINCAASAFPCRPKDLGTYG